MPKRAGFFIVIFAALLFTLPQTATAQDGDGYISYRFKRGDTLIGIANRYFRKPGLYRIVQRRNRISDAKRIRVGRTIRISRSFLKFRRSQARLVSVRGRVLRSGRVAKGGDVIREGASLSTAASSFVSLALEDGSTISLPSNSSMRIRRLRRYVLGGSLDYDFAVSRGGVRSKVSPKRSRDDRYRVRSPRAVSAVRGTDFQTRYDEAANRDYAEVIEGGLEVGMADNHKVAVESGNGLAVNSSGQFAIETLRPAPDLQNPGRTQSAPLVKFAAAPASGSAGQRYTLAADAGFTDMIADAKVNGQTASFSDIPNGNYFIRVRAISETGMEGLPATFAFKRRLNSVKASAGAADDGFAFKWSAVGGGVQRYHFQLFKDSKDSAALIDEVGIEENRIAISDLSPGEYYWRVGVVQYLDGEAATSWTSFEKITLSQ
ncbi:MAG: FecR domain-containing protein [Sphingorhabdus sp.]